MTNIIEVIESIAELEHWTDYSGVADSDKAFAYPPIIVWRHKHPPPGLADFLREAIATFPATIAWEFTVTERNWLLMPARIREYAEANGVGQLPAAKELEAKDPAFGRRANAELQLLAEYIAKAAPVVASLRH